MVEIHCSCNGVDGRVRVSIKSEWLWLLALNSLRLIRSEYEGDIEMRAACSDMLSEFTKTDERGARGRKA